MIPPAVIGPAVRLFGRIEKVDDLADGTVEVHGAASTELRDDQGDIVRATAMRAALPDYMRFPTIREMHQLSAAGSTLAAEVRDDKTTHIVTHVVDPVAVLKVKNGVYRGFSIGGRVTERDPQDRSIITGLILTEISLVDRPANPGAVFDCWKAGALPMSDLAAPVQIWACGNPEHRHTAKSAALSCMEKRAATTGDPAADAAAPVANPAPGDAINPLGEALAKAEKKPVEASTAAATAAAAAPPPRAASDGAEPVWKAADGSTHATQAAAEERSIAVAAAQAADAAAAPMLAALAEIEGKLPVAEPAAKSADAAAAADAAAKGGDEPGDGSKPYGDEDYADPGYRSDKKKRYPLTENGKPSEKRIRAAWNYIHKPKNARPYSADELKRIKAKIVAAWKAHIDKDGPPEAQEEGKSAASSSLLLRAVAQIRVLSPNFVAKSLWDVGRVACVINDLRSVAECLAMEAVMEGDESPAAANLRTLIGQLCEFLVALVAEETSEIAENKEIPPDAVILAAGGTHAADAIVKALGAAKEAERFAAFCAALAAVKAGSRHSRTDQARLDLAHHAATAAMAMPGLSAAAKEHLGHAADEMKAAGAGEAAAVDAGAMHSGTVDTEDGVRTGGNERPPMVTPPAREFDGRNSTVDTGNNPTHAAPQVDAGGTGGGSGIDHIATAAVIDSLAKRHGGHQVLLDVAHDQLRQMTDGAVCAAGKAGARHSADTMAHLQAAHDHLAAAGAACTKAVLNPPPGGEPRPGQYEAERQGTEFDTSKTLSGDLVKVTAERDAMRKLFDSVVPRIDALSKRVEEIARQPVQAGTIANGALPPGIHRVEKTAQPGTASDAANAITDDVLLAEFGKRSEEERAMLLIKAARRDPKAQLHPITLRPLA